MYNWLSYYFDKKKKFDQWPFFEKKKYIKSQCFEKKNFHLCVVFLERLYQKRVCFLNMSQNRIVNHFKYMKWDLIKNQPTV